MIINIGLTLCTLFFSFYVSFSDPGFIAEGSLEETFYDKTVPIVEINKESFLLKYCSTCKIVRDIRVFHCKICNLCVMRHGKFYISTILII